MKYFIAENGQQIGPLEITELTAHGLTVNSLVWHEGLPQWERATNVPELHPLLGITPQPPTPPPFGETIQSESQPAIPAMPVNNYSMPQQTIYVKPETNTPGTIGFILVVIAYVLFWMPGVNSILGLLGLLFSFIGLFKSPRGLAVAGFVMAMIGMGATLFILTSFLGSYAGWNFFFPFLE